MRYIIEQTSSGSLAVCVVKELEGGGIFVGYVYHLWEKGEHPVRGRITSGHDGCSYAWEDLRSRVLFLVPLGSRVSVFGGKSK